MKQADKLNVTITHLERLHNSVNGNPRFRITFDDGSTHLLSSDASLGYCITNTEYRGALNVWLTKAGRVSYATPVAA
jgi:hypothetical protein